MLREHPSVSCLFTLAMLTISVLADTVTLKNGEHLEGKITKETANDITMEVTVAAGITDERVVTKAQIDKIEKVSPETEAYQAIAAIQLGKDSLPVAQYESSIRALQAYVAQYPNSVRAIDVQTTLNSLLEEKKRVEGGEVKIDSRWLSTAEVEKEKVQINARLAFAYMKSQSTAGDYVGAMNTYAAIEKAFPGAAIMPDAIDLATQVMVALKTTLEKAIPNQKAFMTEREKGIAAASPAESAQMKAAVKQEHDAMEATVKAAEAAGKWAPLMPNSEASLVALFNRVKSEGTRIAALPVGKMQQSLQLAVAARETLAGGDVAGAADKLKEATTLWPANELAQRLTKEVAAQKVAATSVAAATPAPVASTPEPATPKPKHISTPVPSTGASTPAGAAQAANADDDRPFLMTLPGAIVLVVGLAAALAGANVFLKMKKRKAEEAENS
jgi:hypothetical protein